MRMPSIRNPGRIKKLLLKDCTAKTSDRVAPQPGMRADARDPGVVSPPTAERISTFTKFILNKQERNF